MLRYWQAALVKISLSAHHPPHDVTFQMARMARAREEGWRGLLDSDESVPSNVIVVIFLD